MTSSESIRERPIAEDPESDWAEHEFVCWSPRDEPMFALFTVAVCGATVVVVWLSTGRIWPTCLVAAGTLIATCRVWLPAVYRIGPLGIRHRIFRRWMLIPWASIVRIRHRREGAILETAESPGPCVAGQLLYVHGGRRPELLRELLDRFARHATRS